MSIMKLIFIFFACISFVFAVDQGQDKNDIFTSSYDDLQGIVGTAIGASALGTITIRDANFPILAFQNINDDVISLQFQMPHSKKLNTNIDSLHVHAYLPIAPTVGDTVIFDYQFVFINNSDITPAVSGWTVGRSTHTFSGSEPQYSNQKINIVTDIPYPTNEGTSSILLFRAIRDSLGVGSDTYDSDIGILYTDVHIQKNRLGSYNEYN